MHDGKEAREAKEVREAWGALSRRHFAGGLGSLALGGAWGLSGPALAAGSQAGDGAGGGGRFGPPRPFGWAWLVDEAQRRARQAWRPRLAPHAVPDFDSHVRLAYGPADRVAGSLRLFPAERDTAPNVVTIHVVEGGLARAVIDSRGLFSNGGVADIAGFRVMNPDGGSDWLAYLGASYFRASGPRGQFGLSARAVAVDTAMPGPEEFPAFTDFWVEAMGADRLMIHALVDSPSLCGAFAFDTARGVGAMTQAVKGALFLRRDIQRLGLAPITSMFDFAEGQRGDRGDWRPEVHDSDGLAIHAGTGERLWRPLGNPQGLRVSMLRADHPKGFGMIQRDHDFSHYQDDYAFYDRRPSLWVEPQGDWGTGVVMLYEMHGTSENIDNMAAMWISDTPARAGQRRDLAYRLTWTNDDPSTDGNAHCVAVFSGPGGVPGGEPIAGATRYVVDFQGDVLAKLGRDGTIVPVTNLPAAALVLASARPVSGQEGLWRVTLDVRTDAVPQGEFRLFLQHGHDAVSETLIEMLHS